MSNGTESIANLEREYLINKILTDAYEENPPLERIGKPKLTTLISLTLDEINELEEAALHPNLPKTADEASRIKAIWVFSGPGTYDQPFKNDRYKDKPWARFMDRIRLNRAAWLMRKLTEEILGNTLDGIRNPEIVRQAFLENGPFLIYNGRHDENDAVRDVLTRPGIVIPKEKVHFIDARIDNTFDQVKTFSLPPGLTLKSGENIALVSHAPHLMRLLHIINKVKPFLEGAKVQLFPIASPSDGRQEYAEMEIRGLLYATFISGEAEETPCPYLL